jgi:hypothetical protein
MSMYAAYVIGVAVAVVGRCLVWWLLITRFDDVMTCVAEPHGRASSRQEME